MKHAAFVIMACSALLLSVFVGAVQSSAATSPAPTPVPRTMPNFSSMKFLLGTWTCQATVRGKTRPDTGTTTVGLDGAYMITHDVAPAFDKYRSRAISSDTYVTYNSTSHMWVSVYVDSFGNYAVSTTPGWHGNTLTTTLKLTNDGSTGSDVLTKISDTQTSDASVTTDPKGHATPVKTTCTKA